jgi:muramoyltetrapeptide carboxypeptidase LdcA involved in peptidoglycan recycling
MKVYCLFVTHSDGITYHYDEFLGVYAHKEDAETEMTRLELVALEAKQKTHSEWNWEEERFFNCEGRLEVREEELL